MRSTAPRPESATGGSAATQAVDADARRWTPKRGVAVAIRATAFVVPFILSAVVARMLQQQLSGSTGVGPFVGRWVVVIAGSTAVLVAADRVTRHLLPIAGLYQVALVFPDQAPSRYKLALRSGSSGALAARLREGGDLGDTPAEAAENALVLLKDLAKHDRLTRGHSERVRAYSEIIGEKLGLPAADLEKLRWAALIHDVGKMAVSPEILNKPGRPTDEEWQELRNHPVAAAHLLAPLEPWLGEWLGAATEHHERVDGNGYPRGLRSWEISLAGKIVAVADAYDCMTSARSYKKALPAEQARFELSRNSGTQFDPEVVRAFLNVSVGRLHLAGGPLAWLTSLPGVRDVATGLSGAAASASGVVAATGVAVVAATTGHAALPAAEPAAARPPAVVAEAPPPAPSEGAGDSGAPSGGSDATGAETPAAGDEPTDRPAAASDRPARRTSGSTTTTSTTTTTTRPAGGRTPTTAPPPTTHAPTTPTTAAPTTRPPTTPPPTTVSHSPVAVDDHATVEGNKRVEVRVLNNDSDADGDLDQSSLRIVGPPSAGEAKVHDKTKIRYDAPKGNRTQQIVIRYRIRDRAGHCSEANLRITVTPER